MVSLPVLPPNRVSAASGQKKESAIETFLNNHTDGNNGIKLEHA